MSTTLLFACGGGGSDDDAEGDGGPREADTSAAAFEAAAEDARNHGWDEQSQALADGRITETEYADALDLTRSCLTDRGLSVSEPTLNPGDQLTLLYEVNFAGLAQDQSDEIIEDCESRYRSLVEEFYRATHEARMDEPLRQGVVECLDAEGLDVSGEEGNFRAFVDSVGEAQRQVISRCVLEVGSNIYPAGTNVNVGY